MGHLRLGRLPKTLHWQGVIGFLTESPDDVAAVARATGAAANARLDRLGSDPSLSYCFWLLTRLMAASREDDFSAALDRLDIGVPPSGSALGFIALLSERIGGEVAGHLESGHFSELASLAFRRTLLETVGQHGRSLFGSSLEDVHHAFQSHATPEQFGDLARRYFADYVARTLQSFVERELSNSVGVGSALTSIDDSAQFSEAFDVYTRQSARIMQNFARDWYSKHNWEARGEISREEAQAFVAVALQKLRSELRQPEQ